MTTYKEILFFVAKCLTISFEKKNRDTIEHILKTKNIDWDAVVKLSTSHHVFQALYCNLKKVDFLKYIPKELVKYMEYITEINRNRNRNIIKQAYELISILSQKGINPIFLKGTGNILQGMYQDIGERMVGDIDFLVSEKDFFKAIRILKKNNYHKPENEMEYNSEFRHYSRLIKPKNIAAVEVHKEITIRKFRNEFNNDVVRRDTLKINDISLLSFENQILASMISIQINDYGYDLKKFSLRNAYDVYLLSKKVNTKKAISKLNKLKEPLNCFLACCNLVFGNLQTINYNKSIETENYLDEFKKSLNKKKPMLNVDIKSIKINFQRRLGIACRSILNKEGRIWLLNRFLSKLGFKKRFKNHQ